MAAELLKSGYAVLLFVLGFILIAPSTNLLPALSLYDSKRVMQLVVLLSSAGWLMASVVSSDGAISTYAMLSKGTRRILSALLAIGCLSSALATFPHYGMLEVSHLCLVAALCLAVAHVVRTNNRSEAIVIAAVTVSASLYSVSFGVGYAMSQTSLTIQLWPSGHIGFEHIRFFNQFQSWSLPILGLAPLVFGRGRRWRSVLLTVPCTIFWTLLIASGGRGTLLGLFAAFIAVLIVFGRSALPWLRVQVISAAIGVLGYVLLFEILASTNASLLDRNVGSDMGRFWYWSQTLTFIQHDWLLGIGPLHFAGFAEEFWSHPHNSLLLFASEWGMLGTALLLTGICWAVLVWLRQSRLAIRQAKNGTNSHVHVGLTAALATAGTHALFSGITVMPMSQTMLAVVVGCTAGLYLRLKSNQPDCSNGSFPIWRRSVLASILTAAVVVVTAVAFPDAIRREQSESNYIEQVEPKLFHPRYWRQGAIRY